MQFPEDSLVTLDCTSPKLSLQHSSDQYRSLECTLAGPHQLKPLHFICIFRSVKGMQQYART